MKTKILFWLGYAALIVFYIALTAYVLFVTTAAFFPAAGYWDYLLPAFGILFTMAGGQDLADIKRMSKK